jgi:hypothetical protein
MTRPAFPMPTRGKGEGRMGVAMAMTPVGRSASRAKGGIPQAGGYGPAGT